MWNSYPFGASTLGGGVSFLSFSLTKGNQASPALRIVWPEARRRLRTGPLARALARSFAAGASPGAHLAEIQLTLENIELFGDFD
jgi:hypothetical protein